VDARLAPLQISDSWEKHKTEIKEGASPLNSPRGPGESPVTSPRKKTTALETQVVTPSKAQVKSHIAKTLIDNPDAKGLTWVQGATGERCQRCSKGGHQRGECPVSSKTPSAAQRIGSKEAQAAVGMEVDEEATESDKELREQRQQAIVPAAGAADPQTGDGKKKKKMPLMEITQTGEKEISAVEVARRIQLKEYEARATNERIQVAIRVLHYLAQDANAPRPEQTAAGRAVKYIRKSALDPVNGGLLVALVRGDSAPDADVYAVFVELDLVISTPLNLAVHSFSMGRLFMPKDFPAEFQQTNPRKMRDVTLSEVAHMALSEEVPEHLKQRNRAFLASIGGLNFQKKELRTMTWADFGFQVNAEPFLSTSVSSWVTLPGEVAECYLNQEQLNFKVVAEAVQVWKDASETCRITPQIQERNETGIKLLREMYHDLKKTARQQGVAFETLCQLVEKGTFLPCEETAPGPSEDSGIVSSSKASGDEEDNQPPVLTVSPISAPPKVGTPKGVVVKQKGNTQTKNAESSAAKTKRKPRNEGGSPVAKRRAARYGKRVIVSEDESEETPLQLNRGKGRPENAPLGPLSFTKMLGLGTKETHTSCDAALLEEHRAAGAFGEEDENEFWADLPAEVDNLDAPFFAWERGPGDGHWGEAASAAPTESGEGASSQARRKGGGL
jgi:hypothetical protein